MHDWEEEEDMEVHNCSGGFPVPTVIRALRGGSRGCPGCPDTRPFDTVPFFEKNIFFKTGADSSDFGLLEEQ